MGPEVCIFTTSFSYDSIYNVTLDFFQLDASGNALVFGGFGATLFFEMRDGDKAELELVLGSALNTSHRLIHKVEHFTAYSPYVGELIQRLVQRADKFVRFGPDVIGGSDDYC